MEQEVGVVKYVAKFALAFLVILLAVGVVLSLLDMNSNAGITIAALMGAAVYAVSKFIEENRRVPVGAEKTKLVWFSFVAAWLISLIPFGVFASFTAEGAEMLKTLRTASIPLLAGVIAFLSLFHLGTLWLSYGLLARKQFEALQKKGKI